MGYFGAEGAAASSSRMQGGDAHDLEADLEAAFADHLMAETRRGVPVNSLY